MFYKKTLNENARQSYLKGFLSAFECFEYLYEAPKHELITKQDISKMKKETWCLVGNHLKKATENYKNDEKR